MDIVFLENEEEVLEGIKLNNVEFECDLNELKELSDVINAYLMELI